MMIVLAALKDWHISGLDIKTAFLYGELDEECHGHVGALNFHLILSYLRTRDPERILPYVDRGMFVF